MAKLEKITATEARFPLTALYLSPMNPRQDVAEADVAELAESIWTAGLIQSIAGMVDKKGMVEIVAGGRRLRALQYLAEKHTDIADTRPELANPLVMLAPDELTAQAWANLENVARRDLHPAEEIRAYGKMAEVGALPALIARSFAVTEKHVYRRLALAKLPAQVIDALGANEINLSMASCFTVCDDETRILEVLEEVKGMQFSDHILKRKLQPSAINSSDRRAIYVGVEAYEAAGGATTTDLFADAVLFMDEALLSDLYIAKLNAEAQEYAHTNGFKWGRGSTESSFYYHEINAGGFTKLHPTRGVLTPEQATRYDDLAEAFEQESLTEEQSAEFAALEDVIEGGFTEDQKAHSGVIFYIDYNGKVSVIEGLVSNEDAAAAAAAGIIEAKVQPTAEKPAISQALADDLRRVSIGARQHAVLQRDPDLLMALLAFQLSGRMGYRTALGIREETITNDPSQTSGYIIDDRLTADKAEAMNHFDEDLAKEFKAFRKQGAEKMQAEIASRLGALVHVMDKTLAAMIDKEVKTDVREVWTPTAANFFSRVGGPYMAQLWRDLLGLNEDHPNATAFDKLKKAEKAESLEKLFMDEAAREAHSLTKKQVERIAKWTPEGM